MVEWLSFDKLKSNRDAFVTVTPTHQSKRIYINSKAVNLLGENIKWVKIGMDWEDKILIIKPLPQRTGDAINLLEGSSNENSNVKLITQSELVDMIKNIAKINKTTRFQAAWNKQKDYLEVYLQEKLQTDK